jgi:hypothetical protein
MTTENQPRKMRSRAITMISSAVILSVGIGYGLSLVGSGLAAKAGNSITVTGSAKASATADNVVWTLMAQESSPNVSAAVKKVEQTVAVASDYLTKGGVPATSIETGAIGTFAIQQYLNGNQTGKVLAYQATQNLIVRSKDVNLIKKLSDGIGALLATGVNMYNNGPQYYVSNLAALRPQLLADAMKDAKLRAQSITSAVGSKLGAVLAVSSGPVQVTAPDSVDTSAGGMYDTATIPKSVTVTVSVSFKVSK